MNRPNKDLLTEWSLNSYADYTNELEKYCDELEAINRELTYVNGSELAQMYKEFFYEYQKALEKACVLLDEFVYFVPMCIVPEEIKGSSADDNCILKSEKEWKEWLLR